jgi:hypothetical protein
MGGLSGAPPSLENLLIVTTVNQEEYLTVKLVPQADPEEAFVKMAEPGHFTHLFSLSRARSLEGYKLGRAMSMIKVHERRPTKVYDSLEVQLRTRWLGKAEDTINDEIQAIDALMRELRDTSVRFKPPTPEAGVAT